MKMASPPDPALKTGLIRLFVAMLILLLSLPACSRSGDEKTSSKSSQKAAGQATGQKSEKKSEHAIPPGKALWVINNSLMDSKLFRIDPSARKVTDRISINGAPRGIAAGEGAIWVTDFSSDKVLRISPTSGSVEASISVAKAPTRITTGEGAVWVISSTEGLLTRIDPKTNQVSSTIRITKSVLTDVAYGENALWVPSVDFLVTRVDPKSGTVAASIHLVGNPNATAVGGGAVWVSNPSFKEILKIDPATNKHTTIKVDHAVRAITFGKDALWLARQQGGSISRLDAASGAMAASFKVAGDVNALCFEGDTLWVTSSAENKLLAVDPGSGNVLGVIQLEAGPAAMAFGP